MNRKSDLDKDPEHLSDEAGQTGVLAQSAEPRPLRSASDSALRTPDSGPTRTAIPSSDPAVQVLESAHQILMMIGANPRAIRPILAQRRLTKETILEAAGSVRDRAAAALADLDTLEAGRRAAHDGAVAQIRARMDTEDAETPPAHGAEVKHQDEGHHAEVARLQGQLDAANAAWARFEVDERAKRTVLTGLHERAAKVSEVYQTL